jgi:hypothetical protein
MVGCCHAHAHAHALVVDRTGRAAGAQRWRMMKATERECRWRWRWRWRWTPSGRRKEKEGAGPRGWRGVSWHCWPATLTLSGLGPSWAQGEDWRAPGREAAAKTSERRWTQRRAYASVRACATWLRPAGRQLGRGANAVLAGEWEGRPLRRRSLPNQCYMRGRRRCRREGAEYRLNQRGTDQTQR